jgi:uncharacterized membrane protein YjfL (UPF0719 family)
MRVAIFLLIGQALLDGLERWLHVSLATLSRKSDTAAAILYALKLWPALTRYADDGRVEIDNSAAERALRGVALGRRNFLSWKPSIETPSLVQMLKWHKYNSIDTAVMSLRLRLIVTVAGIQPVGIAPLARSFGPGFGFVGALRSTPNGTCLRYTTYPGNRGNSHDEECL